MEEAVSIDGVIRPSCIPKGTLQGSTQKYDNNNYTSGPVAFTHSARLEDVETNEQVTSKRHATCFMCKKELKSSHADVLRALSRVRVPFPYAADVCSGGLRDG